MRIIDDVNSTMNRRRAKKNGAHFVRQDAIEEGRSRGELGE